jgi:hypothetical protein
MLNPPRINFDDGPNESGATARPKPCEQDVTSCQVIMQNFANQVIQYMAHRGSAPMVLSIKRTELEDERPARDDNGHQWPNYEYTCGYTSSSMDTNETIAVPLRAAKLEHPENSVLNQWG